MVFKSILQYLVCVEFVLLNATRLYLSSLSTNQSMDTYYTKKKMNKEEFHLYQLNQYYGHHGNQYPYGYPINPYYATTIPTTMSSPSLCTRLKAIYAENSSKLRGLYYQWHHATSQEQKNAINERINEIEAQQFRIEDEMSYIGCY